MQSIYQYIIIIIVSLWLLDQIEPVFFNAILLLAAVSWLKVTLETQWVSVVKVH